MRAHLWGKKHLERRSDVCRGALRGRTLLRRGASRIAVLGGACGRGIADLSRNNIRAIRSLCAWALDHRGAVTDHQRRVETNLMRQLHTLCGGGPSAGGGPAEPRRCRGESARGAQRQPQASTSDVGAGPPARHLGGCRPWRTSARTSLCTALLGLRSSHHGTRTARPGPEAREVAEI